jgi:hypothetical protein
MGALGNRKTPQGWRARGVFNTASDNTNHTPISDILAQHFCCCRGSAICVFCLDWSRLIGRSETHGVSTVLSAWQSISVPGQKYSPEDAP